MTEKSRKPITRRRTDVEAEGMIRLYVDVSVAGEDLRQWSPDRLEALFAGIAQARAAVNGERLAPAVPAVVAVARKLSEAMDDFYEAEVAGNGWVNPERAWEKYALLEVLHDELDAALAAATDENLEGA